MKNLFLVSLLCGSAISATNATKPAIFLNRANVLPEKIATQGAFQALFGTITFIPAALVAVAVKRHAAVATEPHMKGVIGEAPWLLAFATAGGAIFGGASVFLWSQAFASWSEAAASAIWNPDAAVVKTPIAVQM